MTITEQDALIVVDIQNDFCPGGALPVPGGDATAHVASRLMPSFEHIFFTRDWHPSDHCSFALEPEFVDGSWPPHCVQDTPGAEFHGDLMVPLDAPVINKGDDPDREDYSGFGASKLGDQLRQRGVDRVFICGLATEYCVKATAMDALDEGFEVVIVEEGVRGLDNPPGSEAATLEEMQEAGIGIVKIGDLL